MGYFEIAEVDGDVDGAQAQTVAGADVGAGGDRRLAGAHVLAADGVEELLGRRRQGSGLLRRRWRRRE